MQSNRRALPILALAVMLAMLAMLAISPPPAAAAEPLPTLADSADRGFCATVQRFLVDTRLPIDNRLHTDKDAFTASKPGVDPVTTHQFVSRDAAGRAEGISCKTKSADHLRSVHGAAAARDPALAPRSCRDVQRRIVTDVWRALPAPQRAAALQPPRQLMLDADARSYTGSSWIGSPAEVYVADDGMAHLRASALFAEWNDWRWKMMPKSFRGNHYCHLVAPERVRRLLLGEEQLKR